MRRSFDAFQIVTLLIFLLALGYVGWLGYGALPEPEPTPAPERYFDTDQAMILAQAQCDMGPRPTGSPAGWQTGAWLQEQLARAGWQVEAQNFVAGDVPARNIIAKTGQGRLVIVATHYDSARSPSATVDASTASAVAVLLELAAVLDTEALQNEVWLLFLDAQADGQQQGLQSFLQTLDRQPLAVIYLDTIATVLHPLVINPDSDNLLVQNWLLLAQAMGFRGRYSDVAPSVPRAAVASRLAALDVPLLEMAEWGYPAWHTTNDTCEAIDARSMAAPGAMLEAALEQNLLPDFLLTPVPSPVP